ncbi:MAG: DGQHR domain-containing protein [Nitrospira sp.]|nr:DGQHR domain-containing protein [Nitrospira sp.]
MPAVRAVQNGQEVFFAAIPATTYTKLNVQVEHFDSSKDLADEGQGYQRTPENNRGRKFGRYLEEPDAISPTAILLNDRAGDVTYDPRTHTLSIDDASPLFNYDGQHRGLGYKYRVEADPSFGTFPIPVVITKGMSKLKEMTQFRVINTTAKSMATMLVNAILARMQSVQGDGAIDKTAHKSTVGYKVTESLNGDAHSPWYDLIIMANEKAWTKKEVTDDPMREHTRVVKASSFVDALKPIYDYMLSMTIGDDLDTRTGKIAIVVNEFWSAIKEMMPEAFAKPADYALFYSGGIGPLHLVLRDLLIKMHVGRRSFVKSEFIVMMNGSSLLRDPSFWHSANSEGARIYSGKANWGDLAKRIIEDMTEEAAVATV